MRIRKPQTIFTHGIKIRCFKRAILIESADITISHIICKDIDHIWFLIHFTFPISQAGAIACKIFYVFCNQHTISEQFLQPMAPVLFFTFRNYYLHSNYFLP